MLVALVFGSAVATSGTSSAATVTACTFDALCYCVDADLRPAIDQEVNAIRGVIAAQKARGKAVGYVSVPLSTVGGSYFNINAEVAGEVKDRVEARLGAHGAWLLNPGAKEFALSGKPSGADYMLMWTKILEGRDGLGEFDFVYFIGPSDFARHFRLDGKGDLEKLEAAYDDLTKTDDGLKAVDKRSFRDYYALRASAAYSYGSHDEWNIVRIINERRRDADAKTGIAKQMAVFFDGQPVAPGLLEVPIAPGDAGACRS